MIIRSLISERWLYDGGVAFGVVPKSIWGLLYPADENNLVPMVNRLLLAETETRLILVDTGFGHKRDEKYYQYKYITERNDLDRLIRNAGFSVGDITDVYLTHLHDDHAGGAVIRENGVLKPLFPNASHWVSTTQYRWASHPNPRESASFFEENIGVLKDLGLLKFIGNEGIHAEGVEIKLFDGHTAGQMIPLFHTREGIVAYLADFIPSKTHIPLPYLASVDTQPLKAMEEKSAYLQEAVENRHLFYFEHDALNEMCRLEMTTKGVRGGESFNASDIWH
jgi:glyoxylase-like metal-dependent hydrolase (beta-lactamase superfamily II)